jgi:hypothetical protein
MSENTAKPDVAAALAPETPAAVESQIADHSAKMRDDAVKAVEDALRVADGDAPKAKEPAEDSEAPDAPADKPGDAAEAPASAAKLGETPSEAADRRISTILAKREKQAQPKTDAQKLLEEAKKATEEASKAREEIARERAELKAERAKVEKLKDIKNAPEALKDLGWDPDDFVTAAASANTPQGRLEAMVRQQAEVIAKLTTKADTWEKQAEEQKAAAQKHAEEQAVRQTEESFQKVALDTEKFPSLARLYGDDDEDKQVLLMKAHNVARRYRAATGEEATFEQIAEYLEERAQAKLGEDAKEEKASKNGRPQPGGRPTGKRSVNGSDASVRTSLPSVKKTDDLDEMRRMAKLAAERAIRESGA